MNTKRTSFLLLFVLSAACSNGDSPSPLPPTLEEAFYASMEFGGAERTYFVDLPADYSPAEAYPVIFLMHGGGRLGYEGVREQSQLAELGDREGFIIVYPEGIRTFGFRTFNAGNCCPSATTLGTDDVGFVKALLAKLQNELSIDSRRVYAAGFSNGGQLAYRLAHDASETFAAVAAVAGVLQQFPFEPSRSVPIIHFHSYLDTTAPYVGGFSDAPNIDLEFPSVDETLELIARRYGCASQKEVVFSDPDRYDHFRYSACEENAQIELYVSRDGGHSWPGGQAFAGVPKSDQFDASALMWQFFQKYRLP
ncbi:CE1 family esterase [Algoriphagus namhaensis]